MRPVWLVLLLLVPWTAHAENTPLVHLSEIHPNPVAGEREFVEVRAAQDVNLAGWQLEDAAGHSFVFPDWPLGTGRHAVVWGGGDGDWRGPAWSKSSVWNNGGDTVLLRSPTGDVVDALDYGGAHPVPAAGQSLARSGQSWHVADPSPGAGDGVQTNSAHAEVPDVPPLVELSTDSSVVQGELVDVLMQVAEPNGDPLHWSLRDDAGILLEGTTAGNFSWSGPAPAGPWVLRLQATDGHHTVYHNHTVWVVSHALDVRLPPGGIRFSDVVPGSPSVVATGFVEVQNVSGQTRVPRLDIADFVGAQRLVATQHVEVGLLEGNVTNWIPYEKSFMSLPALESGHTMRLMMRLVDVPQPLAAGTYGTSFALVA